MGFKTERSVCLAPEPHRSGKTALGDTWLDWKRGCEWRKMPQWYAQWLDVWNILSHFIYSQGSVEYLSNLAGTTPIYYDEKYMTKKSAVFIQAGWRRPQVVHCKAFRTEVGRTPLILDICILLFFSLFFRLAHHSFHHLRCSYQQQLLRECLATSLSHLHRPGRRL